MDADLQNDPRDIPRLLAGIAQGYDVVSGWRFERKDSLSKKILSWIARVMRRLVTNEPLHDLGCTLKAYRRVCFDGLVLYGEMHRFIPTLLRWKGFRIAELKVNHHPRLHGKSKYRLGRVVRGFLDLISARFMWQFSTRPFHFFALMGSVFLVLGSGVVIVMLGINFVRFNRLSVGPLLLPAVLFVLSGIQFVLFGFLSELQIRTYFSQAQTKSYAIRRVVE
jgi:hypothetical protein